MRTPRQLITWAGACAAAFVAVLALAYFLPAARHADSAAVTDFTSFHGRVLHAVASVFVNLCDWYVYIFLAAAVLLVTLLARGMRRAAAAAVLLVGGTASSQLLKELLAYPRERQISYLHAGHVGHVPIIGSAAYPSGHATAAMALAAAIVLVVPRPYRPLATVAGGVFTLAVSFSLLVLGWHFVSDVIGAFLLSTAWSLIALAGYRAAMNRWPVAGGMRAAARRATVLADWRTAAAALLVGALLVLAIALTRVSELVDYARGHTSFVVAVSSVAASAAALLGGVAVASSRRG
jgi:membrane-associated phospholipid phosphatase